MDISDISALRRYTFPVGGVFLTVPGAVLLAAVIYAYITGAAEITALVIVVLAYLIMLVAGIGDLTAHALLISRITKSGDMPVLLADLKRGRRVFGGDLILGETWAIGRHTGYMIKYSDIVYATQKIVRNKGNEASRNITVVHKNGKAPRVLCALKTGGRSDQELAEVIRFIQEKVSQYAAEDKA